jgi:phosphoribosylanthranilate isomerase
MQKEHDNGKSKHSVQIKICGLTDPEQAVRCADLGADAIGFIFFQKSPRHLAEAKAREISLALADRVCKTGVFVNEAYDRIMQIVALCNLDAVQLHGQESPELVAQLRKTGLIVIKALFVNRQPGLKDAEDYTTSAFLVECAGGKLPGGNAMLWDWGASKEFGASYPLVLAGGLSPGNVVEAITAASPAAVDVSSGVEASPGVKDLRKVERFISAVRGIRTISQKNRIFHHSESEHQT